MIADRTPHHPHPSSERPQAWRVFGAFHKAMHAHRQLLAQMMATAGIPPAQALSLRALGHNDGVTQRDLADILRVSRPTVTVMLQKMEKSGLVERRTDADDQRYTRIYLTEAGWKVHADMHRQLDRFVAETVGCLEDSDQAELERLLGLLNDGMCAAMVDGGIDPGHGAFDGACPIHGTTEDEDTSE